jgi:serine/threonine protein phosphatase PrpC
MTFKSSATTHVGMVRNVNQDSYAERSDIGVWAVADGMGGHEAGEIASATVTDFIKNLAANEDIECMLSAVEEAIMAANLQLTQQAASYDSQAVPGSTVAALIINGNRGAIVWAGDSRIYRRRDQAITQLVNP